MSGWLMILAGALKVTVVLKQKETALMWSASVTMVLVTSGQGTLVLAVSNFHLPSS